MVNLGFHFLRGIDRSSQDGRFNQSVNQSKESPAERRACAAIFASEFESAQLQIQIEPLLDRKLISHVKSQSKSRTTKMNFEPANFLEVLTQKCFQPIRSKRFARDESLK